MRPIVIAVVIAMAVGQFRLAGADTAAVAKHAGTTFMIAPGPLRPGHVQDDLKDASGATVIHYAMEAPATLPTARRLAALIVFHGSGHTAEQHIDIWKPALTKAGVDQQYVLFSLKSQGEAWGRVDDPHVTAAIDWLLATYPIDRRRVHLVGFSAGANYVGVYGLAHQERFASLSCYCCPFRVAAPPNGDLADAPGIYLSFGTADGFLPGTPGREMRERIRAVGYRYVYREIAGGGHGFGPGDTVTVDDVRWMEQSRSRHVPLEADQAAFVQTARDVRSVEAIWRDPATAAEAAYIGGQYAEAMALKAIGSKDLAVRIALTTAASSGLFGPELLRAIGHTLADPSAEVRLRAIAALAPAANWNWREAKTMLAAFVTSPKCALDERLVALKAFADAAQLIGLAERYDDDLIVPTLVALLDDAQAPIRAAALAALTPLHADTFGYDPDTKDHAKALAEWQSWATAKCGGYTYDQAKPPKK